MKLNQEIQNEPLDEPLKEPLEQRILQYIIANPKITYDTLVKDLNVSKSTIKRCIANLTKSGRLERKGGKRYGHWKVN